MQNHILSQFWQISLLHAKKKQKKKKQKKNPENSVTDREIEKCTNRHEFIGPFQKRGIQYPFC